ncbi:MAG: cobalt-precorrin-6A reductase [Cyanobacteria bacterium REEB459]|nr:cobalt-precorrin-6A reductase [Cyanobacteria bacterium REEB459]
MTPTPEQPQLWIIGGTGEAVVLASGLVDLEIACVVTVTTPAASQAYPSRPGLQVQVGALAGEALSGFIQQQRIGAILDASHPFAIEISQAAIAAAHQRQIPYWRYERPAVSLPAHPLVRQVADLNQVLRSGLLAQQRVLLTLGYRWLWAFQPWQQQSTLFARILPSPVALQAALAAGFSPDRLIALRPPLSVDLELALWQHWQITTVITKASGLAGGEGIKQTVCQRLGIPLWVIDRPPLSYPFVSQDLRALVGISHQWWISKKISVNF